MIRAITLAEPEGYIRIFIDLGVSLAPLLKELARREVSPQFVHQLLVECQKARPEGLASANPLAEPLTARELEITKLLASGFSNQEIAQKLILTVGTIKSHTHNIYGKLGVRNRTQAIKCATVLNLI